MSVLRPGLLLRLCYPGARSAPACPVGHDPCGSECRGVLRVALQLCLFDAAAAPPDLMHWQEPARGLVDVHDAVSTDCVLVHEPAELDEEPVRLRSSFTHVAGFL